jgi:hypothetical protein
MSKLLSIGYLNSLKVYIACPKADSDVQVKEKVDYNIKDYYPWQLRWFKSDIKGDR